MLLVIAYQSFQSRYCIQYICNFSAVSYSNKHNLRAGFLQTVKIIESRQRGQRTFLPHKLLHNPSIQKGIMPKYSIHNICISGANNYDKYKTLQHGIPGRYVQAPTPLTRQLKPTNPISSLDIYQNVKAGKRNAASYCDQIPQQWYTYLHRCRPPKPSSDNKSTLESCLQHISTYLYHYHLHRQVRQPCRKQIRCYPHTGGN